MNAACEAIKSQTHCTEANPYDMILDKSLSLKYWKHDKWLVIFCTSPASRGFFL